MKKIIISILAILMVILLLTVATGCNQSLELGCYKFKRIHIFTRDDNDQCLTVEKWHNLDFGIEVKTKECGYLWLTAGTYMLCEDECPICAKKGK